MNYIDLAKALQKLSYLLYFFYRLILSYVALGDKVYTLLLIEHGVSGVMCGQQLCGTFTSINKDSNITCP